MGYANAGKYVCPGSWERFTCLGRSGSSMKEARIKIMTEYFKRMTEGYEFFAIQNPRTLAPETILNAK